ncbi:MAG TPA: HNH endonuclease [Candidatus Paceibacterota bacterium]|nr:HNH endonuclease [Candidatus Paceibacterota bacterium]
MYDIWDPNTWDWGEGEFRIYLDDNARYWCVVDEIDYHWAIQWRWHVNAIHHTRNGTKLYARRRPRQADGRMASYYLHKEILRRTGVLPPSPLHTIADHRDGDEFNCRRANLRWATPRMNRLNLHGVMPYDLIEGMTSDKLELARSVEPAAEARAGGMRTGAPALGFSGSGDDGPAPDG